MRGSFTGSFRILHQLGGDAMKVNESSNPRNSLLHPAISLEKAGFREHIHHRKTSKSQVSSGKSVCTQCTNMYIPSDRQRMSVVTKRSATVERKVGGDTPVIVTADRNHRRN